MQISDQEYDRLRAERVKALGYDESEESYGAAWALLGVMIAGKIAIMVALVFMMPSTRMIAFLAAYNWSWIVVVLVLGGGPAAFWVRLVRVRRKRAALLRAEWEVDEEPGVPAVSSPRR